MKNIIKKWLGIHLTRSDFMDWTEELFLPCHKCRYICRVHDMKKITVSMEELIKTKGSSFRIEVEDKTLEEHYCVKCSPNYDKHVLCSLGNKYYKENVEVNEKGKPICTKK